MKKISIIFIFFIIVLKCCTMYAFANEYYSIQVPTSYTEVADGSFTDEFGRNINIQINKYTGSKKGKLYSENNLEEIIKGFSKDVSDYRELLRKELEEKNENYGSELTEEEIDGFVNSFKFDYVEEKEITTFSKNNYDCFHIISHYSLGETGYFSNQYMLLSGNNIITLTITADELEYFESSEIRRTLDSFEVKNFIPYKEEQTIWEKMFAAMISSIIIIGISSIFTKNNQKEQKNANDENYKNKEENIGKNSDNITKVCLSDPDEIVIRDRSNGWNVYGEDIKIHKDTDKKYCTNCGKNTEDTWAYCNYCGHKLKE